jgi:hypothetical protein
MDRMRSYGCERRRRRLTLGHEFPDAAGAVVAGEGLAGAVLDVPQPQRAVHRAGQQRMRRVVPLHPLG